jgi:acyl-CoA-dependent ceramide synthase
MLLALTHICFPRARRRTSTFFRFSYHNPSTGQYGCGTDDLPLVALWVVIFTGLRVAVMDYILKPLAMAWLICYCICSWSLGMVCISSTELALRPWR